MSWDLTCRTPECESTDTSGDDAFNGFCPSCADRLWGMTCAVCEQPIHVDPHTGACRHTNTDGGVDHAADAHHDPVDDEALALL